MANRRECLTAGEGEGRKKGEGEGGGGQEGEGGKSTRCTHAGYWRGGGGRKVSLSALKIEGLALALGCSYWNMTDLVNGANIGCTGVYRKRSVSSNAPSTMDIPREITDAVCDWVTKGFAFGPVDRADLPAGAKVNGIMCRVKPYGRARIILNMSAPSGRSVNDRIDNTQFPAAMSSTGKWLQVLDSVGRDCTILKIDWADAYPTSMCRSGRQTRTCNGLAGWGNISRNSA
jgi:hypothetical protein